MVESYIFAHKMSCQPFEHNDYSFLYQLMSERVGGGGRSAFSEQLKKNLIALRILYSQWNPRCFGTSFPGSKYFYLLT